MHVACRISPDVLHGTFLSCESVLNSLSNLFSGVSTVCSVKVVHSLSCMFTAIIFWDCKKSHASAALYP